MAPLAALNLTPYLGLSAECFFCYMVHLTGSGYIIVNGGQLQGAGLGTSTINKLNNGFNQF